MMSTPSRISSRTPLRNSSGPSMVNAIEVSCGMCIIRMSPRPAVTVSHGLAASNLGPNDLTRVDRVTDYDVQARFSRSGADTASDSTIQIKTRVAHRNQRALFWRHHADRTQVVGVVNAQMRVRLDQSRHQRARAGTIDDSERLHASAIVDPRATAGDSIPFHEHFANKRVLRQSSRARLRF